MTLHLAYCCVCFEVHLLHLQETFTAESIDDTDCRLALHLETTVFEYPYEYDVKMLTQPCKKMAIGVV